jgi:hypothetical protein
MSVFEILKRYTYDENIIKLLSKFEKNEFEGYEYSKCVLSLGENKVNLGGLSNSNSVKENGEIFKQFLNFVDACARSYERSRNNKDFTKNREDSEKSTCHVEWKKQKKENKDRLINHFTLKMKSKYKLSYSEQFKLENIIIINIKLNYIPSSSIIIENNEIVEIRNLVFDETKREWDVIKKLSSTGSLPLGNQSSQNSQHSQSYSSSSSGELSNIYSKIDKYLEMRRFTYS